MKTLFLFDEDNFVYRMDPSIVGSFDNVLARLSQQAFSTAWKACVFDVATGVAEGKPVYGQLHFNISVSPHGDIVYWGVIPGLIFDTRFAIEGSGSSARLTADYMRRHLDAFEDKLFWNARVIGQDSQLLAIEPILAFVFPHSTNGHRSVVPHVAFRLIDRSSSTPKIEGTYLPPIPNVYRDLRICMGNRWNSGADRNNNEQVVQDSIKWFFESRMNSDLGATDADRQEVSSELFSWDLHKQQLAPKNNYKNYLTVPTSNVWINGLPLAPFRS